MSMFGGTGGYFRLDSWILANIVQLGTFKEEGGFCEKLSGIRVEARAKQDVRPPVPTAARRCLGARLRAGRTRVRFFGAALVIRIARA